MSYKQALLQSRELADRIASGEYSQEKKVERQEKTQGLVARPSRDMPELRGEEAPDNQEAQIMMASYIASLRRKNEAPAVEEGIDTRTVTTAPRPRSRDDGGDAEPLRMQASELLADEGFSTKLAEMKGKYPGLTEGEIFRVIKGESAFNLRAKNPSGATGLFQFIPSTAKELGVTTDQIAQMSAGEQLALYDKYLEKWGYDGSISLGAMQAAPAFAKRDPNTVVYKKGSAAWRQNPGWRTSEGGDITLASIDNYYRRQ
jgi:hypothetical protein